MAFGRLGILKKWVHANQLIRPVSLFVLPHLVCIGCLGFPPERKI